MYFWLYMNYWWIVYIPELLIFRNYQPSWITALVSACQKYKRYNSLGDKSCDNMWLHNLTISLILVVSETLKKGMVYRIDHNPFVRNICKISAEYKRKLDYCCLGLDESKDLFPALESIPTSNLTLSKVIGKLNTDIWSWACVNASSWGLQLQPWSIVSLTSCHPEWWIIIGYLQTQISEPSLYPCTTNNWDECFCHHK